MSLGLLTKTVANTALVSQGIQPTLSQLTPIFLREMSRVLHDLTRQHTCYDSAMVYGTKRKEFKRRTSRKAAVFIPLCHVNDKASVMFTVRSTNVGSHKGHVSFPGGHMEGSEGPVDAAVRELREEIGGVGNVEILGLYHDVQAVTGTWVTPVLGYIKNDLGDLARLRPNPSEVQQVFTIPLEELLATEDKCFRLRRRRSTTGENAFFGHFFCEAANILNKDVKDDIDFYERHHQVGHTVRPKGVVQIFKSGPKPVWGLSAFVLDEILNKVIIPAKENVEDQGKFEGTALENLEILRSEQRFL